MGFSELCSFQYERTIGLLFKVKEKQQQQQQQKKTRSIYSGSQMNRELKCISIHYILIHYNSLMYSLRNLKNL